MICPHFPVFILMREKELYSLSQLLQFYCENSPVLQVHSKPGVSLYTVSHCTQREVYGNVTEISYGWKPGLLPNCISLSCSSDISFSSSVLNVFHNTENIYLGLILEMEDTAITSQAVLITDTYGIAVCQTLERCIAFIKCKFFLMSYMN